MLPRYRWLLATVLLIAAAAVASTVFTGCASSRAPDTNSVVHGLCSTTAGALVTGQTVDLRANGATSMSMVTDAGGRYQFDNVAIGDYEVVPRGSPPGFVWKPTQATAIVDRTNLTIEANFELIPGGQGIAGFLRTADGSPVAGHTVNLAQKQGGGASTAQLPQTTTSGPDGAYGFGGIPAGDYVVTPDPPAIGVFWDPQQRDLTVPAGQTVANQDFTLRPVAPPADCGADAVCGTLIDLNGDPFPNHPVDMLSHINGSVIAQALSGADGDYVFPNVPPGEYRLAPGWVQQGLFWAPEFLDITKKDGDPLPNQDFMQTDILPVQPGEILGFVKNAEGNPVPLINMELWRYGEAVAQAQSSPNGVYRFPSLQPGDYEVWGNYPPAGLYFDPWSRQVTMLPDGSGVENVNFELRAGGQYTVRVPIHNETGGPLEGVEVLLQNPAAGGWQSTTGPEGVAVFTDIPSGALTAAVTSPSEQQGWYWKPAWLWVHLGDQDVTADPIVGRQTPWD